MVFLKKSIFAYLICDICIPSIFPGTFWFFWLQCTQGWIYVQKNLKLSLLKSGYSETVCPDQPENLQNCLSIFFKTVQNVQKHNSIFSSNVEEYHQLTLLFQYKRDSGVCAGWFIKMRKDFSTYFPHLFGPKLSITSQNFWNCLLGFETVCPEKDKQTAFYSPLSVHFILKCYHRK